MDVDTATSIAQAPAKHALPELEIYSYLLVLIFLIDNKRYEEVQYLLRTPKYSFTHNSHFYYFFSGEELFFCEHHKAQSLKPKNC